MSKSMSEEAYRLLSSATHYENSPYVCPSIFNRKQPLTRNSYYTAWRRILDRAGVPPVGTHEIRHRSATDIANSGIPVKVGMALTAHKTVTMFMRYVHTEDDPVRAAAELVANRRKTVVESHPISPNDIPEPIADTSGATPPSLPPPQGENRSTPPGSKRAASTST
ncbi:protein of unknown function [Candidatus Nitrotoga arctica]|uniref:Tyr recombinase domain-containing protein n=1 Tax=Candidatus Nitrotoga arctica TaxID=453162 RepID=A0ABM8Z0P3_9PROT|nr:protein of unknown function [Candidatus Nitrotoga arctica]